MNRYEPFLDPSPAAPDWIPDELIAQYGEEARRRVRRRHSTLRRWSAGLHRRPPASLPRHRPLHEAAAVFAWLLIVLGIGAAIGYTVYLWPWVGLYILLPFAALFALSLLAVSKLDGGHPRTPAA